MNENIIYFLISMGLNCAWFAMYLSCPKEGISNKGVEHGREDTICENQTGRSVEKHG